MKGKILLASAIGFLLILPSVTFAVNTTTLSGVLEASQGGSTPTPAPAGGKSVPMLTTTDFKLNPKDFSPSNKSYTAGGGNIANMIGDLVRMMLIAISTIAVISIAIGGAMMAISGGDSDRVTKGKAILIHSLQALAVSLSAYFIIKFVSWVIG